jgi:hypothetical protein
MVQFYYAIEEKNGKTEYDCQPPQPDTCVNALFPHAGYSPCRYERKQQKKQSRYDFKSEKITQLRRKFVG